MRHAEIDGEGKITPAGIEDSSEFGLVIQEKRAFEIKTRQEYKENEDPAYHLVFSSSSECCYTTALFICRGIQKPIKSMFLSVPDLEDLAIRDEILKAGDGHAVKGLYVLAPKSVTAEEILKIAAKRALQFRNWIKDFWLSEACDSVDLEVLAVTHDLSLSAFCIFLKGYPFSLESFEKIGGSFGPFEGIKLSETIYLPSVEKIVRR